jgi:hypothetical protein
VPEHEGVGEELLVLRLETHLLRRLARKSLARACHRCL